jgi:TonB family protein
VTIGHYPKRIAGTSPVMPQAAKDAFHNGKVTVSYSIDAAGLPTDAKVTRSSKSDLIDGVVLAAIAAYRFEKPLGLDGKPITLPAAAKHHFSQGDGEGSYIQSLKTLPCRTVVGETDWWIAAHPGEKPINMDFYAFMAGLSFIAPQALGWGSPDIMTINARHTKAWNRALEACRAKPNSTFLSEYRKG